MASCVLVALLFAESLLRRAFSMSSKVVELRNAMRLLSGDQTGPDAPFGRSVMIQASPPASESIAICGGLGFPVSSLSPPRTKAMRLPSGDQRGCASCLPFVIRTGVSLPDVATIQMEVSYPVRFSSTLTRVNATRVPSGESCGLATQTKSKRSFSVMARAWEPEGFCAPSEVTITRLMIATAKRSFMRILLSHCRERAIVLLPELVVKLQSCPTCPLFQFFSG